MEYVIFWGYHCEDGEPCFESKNGLSRNNPHHSDVHKFPNTQEATAYLESFYGNTMNAIIITVKEALIKAFNA